MGAAIGKALDKYGGVGLGQVIDVSPATFRMVGKAAEAVPAPALVAPLATEAIREMGEEEPKE